VTWGVSCSREYYLILPLHLDTTLVSASVLEVLMNRMGGAGAYTFEKGSGTVNLEATGEYGWVLERAKLVVEKAFTVVDLVEVTKQSTRRRVAGVLAIVDGF